jgi:hypothetical protein
MKNGAHIGMTFKDTKRFTARLCEQKITVRAEKERAAGKNQRRKPFFHESKFPPQTVTTHFDPKRKRAAVFLYGPNIMLCRTGVSSQRTALCEEWKWQTSVVEGRCDGMMRYAISFRLNAAQIPAVNRQRMTNAPNALSNGFRLRLDLRFMPLPFPDFECGISATVHRMSRKLTDAAFRKPDFASTAPTRMLCIL